MFVVIKNGGKQYIAEHGSVLSLEKIDGEEGDSVDLDVIMTAEGDKLDFKVKKVKAQILRHYKDDKVSIFKHTKRHHDKQKNGHRQMLTSVKIEL